MLSFYPGIVFLFILLSVLAADYLLDRQNLSPGMRQEAIDAPGLGVLLLLLVLLIHLCELAAVSIGAVALLRTQQQRLFAVLGIIISAMILLLSLIQNTIWTPLGGYPSS
jgi:hypothetical protein